MVKLVQKKVTETERQKNQVAMGWYSRSDMKTELKWNSKLARNPPYELQSILSSLDFIMMFRSKRKSSLR